MAGANPFLGRFMPFKPLLSLRLAALIAEPDRAGLLRRIIAAQPPLTARPAAIYLATPRRFLRPDRLARKRTALTNLLAVIASAQTAAMARGLGFRIVAVDQLPHLPPARLVLSHHTVDDPSFARLRAAGSAVWHVKTGDLPDSIVFDRRGFSGWSELAGKGLQDLGLQDIDPDMAARFFAESRTAIVGGNVSKYVQAAGGDAQALRGPYVFVALQTVGDMVQKKAYLPMLDMLRIVAERFQGTPYHVVVKRHPKCRSPLVAAALRDLSAQPHVQVTDMSIHRVLEGASALITVNSGVGSEAMLHRVPVYCFGAADYAPIAHQVRSAQEFRALTDPLRAACSEDELLRFHWYYRHRHQAIGQKALDSRIAGLIDEAQKPATV